MAEENIQQEQSQAPFQLAKMDAAELEAMNAEITVILEKYNAEIGVVSQMQFLKRVPVKNEQASNTTEKENESETEKGFEAKP